MKINRVLTVAVAVLFALSIWAYRDSVTRAERFERGQPFLSSLDLGKIATLTVTKGDEAVTLKRQGEGFEVTDRHGYPARNESVNRLVRDLLGITLEKEVGRGAALQEDLEIEPMGEQSVDLEMRDASGDVMVQTRVGKGLEGGRGSYLQRLDLEDGAIYLSQRSISLPTGVDSFLDKEIVDVAQAEIVAVDGFDFSFTRSDDGLALAAVPPGMREKTSEISKLESFPTRLSYEHVHLASDEQVRSLEFQHRLRYTLADGSSYLFDTATRDDRQFVRITGAHEIDRVEFSLDSPEDELEEKAEALSRADEIKELNTFHGSWVYELPKHKAEALALTLDDLVEEES